MHSSLWLSALLLLPVLGAALALAVRTTKGASYLVAVVTAALEFVFSLVVAVLYNAHVAGAHTFDFVYRVVLSHQLGLAYSVGVDGISLLMVVLTSFTVLVALVGGRNTHREGPYVVWQLLLLATTMGCFVATDLLEFFIFFELILVPCYFMIEGWGGEARKAAAMKFFLYTFTGSAFALVAIIVLGFTHQHQTHGALTFDYAALGTTAMTTATAVWLFVAFAVAFGVKAPIWPLHTWSPPTYGESPTAAAVELSALLTKLGSYALLRFAVGLLPLALPHVRPVLLTLAVIGILYGSMVACNAPDLRRFVAYSSLAQMGFITLGVMAGTKVAIEGALLLMLNHGIITAGVFLLIGYLERRRGNVTMAGLRGLQGPLPVLAAVFTVLMLATMGLPGLNGFVSEYLILLGTFQAHAWWAVVATLGVVASAVYWLWAYQRAFHGVASTEDAALSDATTAERWTLAPIVALVVVLGVFPTPLLNRIAPSVQQLVTHSAVTSTPGATK